MTYIAILRRNYGTSSQQTTMIRLGVCNGVRAACHKAAVKAERLQTPNVTPWIVYDVCAVV